MKKVTIIPGCVSCGSCEAICPDVFEVKEVAQIKEQANIEQNEKKIKEAAQMCPVAAIEIEE